MMGDSNQGISTMSMLSDRGILQALELKAISISPFSMSQLQPATYDLKLGPTLKRMKIGHTPIDPDQDTTNEFEVVASFTQGQDFYLLPGQFVLGSVVEYIKIGERFAAKMEGKSSRGRVGLLAHVTAGFVDPGYEGNLTLEMCNISSRPVILRPDMRICQIAFWPLSSPAMRPYGHPELGSKYKGDVEPEPAKATKLLNT